MKPYPVVTLLLGLAAAEVAVAQYNGVDFPAGDASFADAVISYQPTYSGSAAPTDPLYANPAAALGRPDFVGDHNGTGGDFNGTGAVALGDGGRLELRFVDNVISNGAGVDLAVYERGVAEAFAVAVRPANATTRTLLAGWCATNFCGVGTWVPVNDVVAIDLDAVFPGFAAGTLRFDAVQLTDDLTQGAHTGDKVGADIDAAGAVLSDAIVCGDGRTEGAEQCDDGDTTAGDGCSDTCRVERCWVCSGTDPSTCATNPGGPCDDGEPCTTDDVCGGPSGLTCIGGPPPNCDDGNVCTDDICQSGVGCRWVPNRIACDDGSTCSVGDRCAGGSCVGTAVESSGCRQSHGPTQIRVLNRLSDDADALVWTWPNGDATSLDEFADPRTASGTYELCLFDDGPSGNRRLRASARAAKAQACGSNDCWRLKGTSAFLFKNPSATYGVRQLLLKKGATGKAKILVKGRGRALRLGDDATMILPLRVELRDTATGLCWEATYSNAVRNDSNRFKAKR